MDSTIACLGHNIGRMFLFSLVVLSSGVNVLFLGEPKLEDSGLQVL
jgi:hypothetical protein